MFKKLIAFCILASSFAHGTTVLHSGNKTYFIPSLESKYLSWDYIQQSMPAIGSTWTGTAASSLYAATGTNCTMVSAVAVTSTPLTTGTCTTTSAKLVLIDVGHGLALDTFTVTDSKSNIITCNTVIFVHTGTSGTNLCYIINGTVGTLHTFSFTLTSATTTRAAIGGFPYTYTGATPALDVASAGAFAAGSAVSPGSITPAGNGELYAVSSAGNGIGASAIVVAAPCAIPTGGSVTAQWDSMIGTNIQTTGSATNCQVTYTGDSSVIAIAAFFK